MKFLINSVALTCCLLIGSLAYGANWQKQGSYNGDCRARPSDTVCVRYEDGFVWVVRGAITGWDKRTEGGQNIQVAIATTGRYQHILHTDYVCAFKSCEPLKFPPNTEGGIPIDGGTNVLHR
jgi:hypothetical protein